MTLSGGNLTKCATSRRKILSLRQLEMYTMFHKTTPYLIAHNFGKSWPIFKTISPFDSAVIECIWLLNSDDKKYGNVVSDTVWRELQLLTMILLGAVSGEQWCRGVVLLLESRLNLCNCESEQEMLRARRNCLHQRRDRQQQPDTHYQNTCKNTTGLLN